MSESTSSETGSIISSPRVRKRKQFGDDFYVYEKKKRSKVSNKTNSDNTAINGSSESPKKSKQTPKLATLLDPSFINDASSSQNGFSDCDSERNQPKGTLYQNGLHVSHTHPEDGLVEGKSIKVFSFSAASDIAAYFKNEAMQLSNESNESSLQSLFEAKDCNENHFECVNPDALVVKNIDLCSEHSNSVDFEESETKFDEESHGNMLTEHSNSVNFEESETKFEESHGNVLTEHSNSVDFEESETKFEESPSLMTNCDSLLTDESNLLESQEKTEKVSFIENSVNISCNAVVEVKKESPNLESSKDSFPENVKLELNNKGSTPAPIRRRSSRIKREDTSNISVKEELSQNNTHKINETETVNSENLEDETEASFQDVEKCLSKTDNSLDTKIKELKKSKKESESTRISPENKEPPKKRGRKPKSTSEPTLIRLDKASNSDITISKFTNELCFACKEKKKDAVQCSIESCKKFYHLDCLNELPTSRTEVKACSLHTCLTCYNLNPKLSQNSKGDMYKCLECPTAFHKTAACHIPGAVLKTGDVMSCPDHFSPEKLRQYPGIVNLPFCVTCGMNRDLIFCSLCPYATHRTCEAMEMTKHGNKCYNCVKRKSLQSGDVIWAKVYGFRWWPAKILSVAEIDDKVTGIIHYEGEFPVKFFGTGEIYWVQKSRVYPFVYKRVERENFAVKHYFKKAALSPTFDDAINCALQATNNMIVSVSNTVLPESKKYPPYKHIKSNRPIGSVQIYTADEFDNNPCNCKADDPDPCGYDAVCLNRSMCTECAPDVCNARERCQNQKFQKRDYAPAKPYWTAIRGWGLQAMANIKQGHFVSEYCGDLIDEEECQRRIKQKQAIGDNNFYFCTLDSTRIIDAGPKGNFSRFMNHSCEPNCVTQKWIVNGDARVGIFAKYDIPAGSELTFDYQMDFSHFKKLKCNCGSKKCSGIIGKKPQSGATQKKDLSDSEDEASENSKDDDGSENVSKKRRGAKRKVGNGTSKNKEGEAQEKGPVTNAVKKKSVNTSNTKASTKKSDKIMCFKCKTGGKLVHCSLKDCGKAYHIRCIKPSFGDKEPPSKSWECPHHFCAKCKQKATYSCFECPKSFCDIHVTNKTRKKFLCPKHL